VDRKKPFFFRKSLGRKGIKKEGGRKTVAAGPEIPAVPGMPSELR
jgi:hypothetical protein